MKPRFIFGALALVLAATAMHPPAAVTSLQTASAVVTIPYEHPSPVDDRPVVAAPVVPLETTETTTTSPATTLPPPPPPSSPPETGSVVEDAIATNFGSLYESALRVAKCESSLNPDSVSSGGGNWGLFQINKVHSGSFESVTGHPWSDILDPYLNSQFAKWLYDQSGGWGPWTCGYRA